VGTLDAVQCAEEVAVVATRTERPSRVEVPAGEIAPVPDDDFLSSIEVSPQGGDPAAARRRRAEVLVAFAGGRRGPLEELRLRYLRRLHRASGDFKATEGRGWSRRLSR
jgi:hypothetical protein